MNESNIKYGYSLMVHDATGAILNPGFQEQNLCNQGHNIEVRGAILGPPRGPIFLTGPIFAPGAGPAIANYLMHSGS